MTLETAPSARRPGARVPVSVVVTTRSRPTLLRAALRSIAEQTYEGPVELIVVYDQEDADRSLAGDVPTAEQAGPRSIVVLANGRTPGLAGARNSGVDASSGELVAFCDDDDRWAPHKLLTQVTALTASGAGLAVCGIEIERADSRFIRIPSPDDVTVERLSRRRVMEAHPSTVLLSREALDRIGPVDESIPGGYGEDYDWMLRACATEQIAVVPEPLVHVLWHKGSFFSTRWRTISDALDYLVDKHASIRDSRGGLARVYGQKAFALAALGSRREALACAWRSARLNPWEPRAYLATLVACRVVAAERVVEELNARGRGL